MYNFKSPVCLRPMPTRGLYLFKMPGYSRVKGHKQNIDTLWFGGNPKFCKSDTIPFQYMALN